MPKNKPTDKEKKRPTNQLWFIEQRKLSKSIYRNGRRLKMLYNCRNLSCLSSMSYMSCLSSVSFDSKSEQMTEMTEMTSILYPRRPQNDQKQLQEFFNWFIQFICFISFIWFNQYQAGLFKPIKPNKVFFVKQCFLGGFTMTKLTPMRAIRKFCVECAGNPIGVRTCSAQACHLWRFRFGMHIYRWKKKTARNRSKSTLFLNKKKMEDSDNHEKS